MLPFRIRVPRGAFVVGLLSMAALVLVPLASGRPDAGVRSSIESCSSLYMPSCNLFFSVGLTSAGARPQDNWPILNGFAKLRVTGGWVRGSDGCSGTNTRAVVTGANSGASLSPSLSYQGTKAGLDHVSATISVSGCNGWVYHVYVNGVLDGPFKFSVNWASNKKNNVCDPGGGPAGLKSFNFAKAWGRQCVDDPISDATGAFSTGVTDITLAAPGLPFRYTRYYSSNDSRTGSMGYGWHTDYDSWMTGVGGTAPTVLMGSGEQITFAKQPDGSFTAPGWSNATLSLSGSLYTLKQADLTKWQFSASSGALSSIVDGNGNQLQVFGSAGQPTSVTTSNGKTITFTYTSGRVSKVTLPDGRNVQYGYSAAGDLNSVTDAAGRVTGYTYDSNHQLLTEVDPRGHTVVTNVYGDYGRVVSQTDGRGKTTTYAFTPPSCDGDPSCSDAKSTTTDPRGHTWTNTYNTDGLLTSETDPLGHKTSYSYDTTTLDPLSRTDPLSQTTQYQYDPKHNLIQTSYPNAVTTAASYDSLNQVATSTNGRGKTTTYTRDSNGNPTQVQREGGLPVSYTYNSRGQVATMTDQRGKTSTFSYDSNGYLASVTSPLGNKTSYGYDTSGRRTTIVDPRGNVTGANPADYTTTIAYNNADQVTSVTDPLGHSWSYTYDADGNLLTKTDPNNHQWQYDYDNANNLIKATAPDGTYTTYTYDNAGNLTSKTDANNHTTSYGYDDANRLITITDPLNRLWTRYYDDASRLTSIHTPSGGTITYSYDTMGRRTAISYSDSTPAATYSFDGNGNRTAMTDGAGSVTYTYDALDQLTSVSRGTDTLSYTYDDAGNLLSRQYPDGTTTTYTYNNDGRMATATTGANTTAYAYDAAGHLTSTILPNGVTETSTYDRAGRLTTRNDGFRTFTYGYDAAGNVTSRTVGTATTNYTYDSLDRLIGASGATSLSYAYDNLGNRTSATDASGTTTYTYDAADHLTSAVGPSGTTNYTFDTSGNETGVGNWTYTINLAGQMTAATSGTTGTSYTYDGDGNRLTQTTGATTTHLLWDTQGALPQLAEEADDSGSVLRTYSYGVGRIAMTTPTVTAYYSTDMLGSVTELSGASGASLGEFDRKPFGDGAVASGVDSSVTGNPFGYTGEYADPVTGLIDLRARQYDSAVGRFLSPDPLGSDPLSSTYVYVADDPLTYVDPTGMTRMPPSLTGCGAQCPQATGISRGCGSGCKVDGLHGGLPPFICVGRCQHNATTGEKCVRVGLAIICVVVGVAGPKGGDEPVHRPEPPPVTGPVVPGGRPPAGGPGGRGGGGGGGDGGGGPGGRGSGDGNGDGDGDGGDIEA